MEIPWYFLSLFFFTSSFILSNSDYKKALEFLGLKLDKKILPRHMTNGVFALAGCLIASVLLVVVLSYIVQSPENYAEKIKTTLGGFQIAGLIAGFTLLPLGEELFFRGLLFQKFKKKYGWLAGALFSSTVFALGHNGYFSYTVMLNAFLIGMVLCYATHRTKSLIPAILAHASINLIGILQSGLLL
jgi:membrane protease YdiL (CAAX protease family)